MSLSALYEYVSAQSNVTTMVIRKVAAYDAMHAKLAEEVAISGAMAGDYRFDTRMRKPPGSMCWSMEPVLK